MEKKTLLEILGDDIEILDSQIKLLNNNLNILNEKLGGIKKIYSLLIDQDPNMAQEIRKNSLKVIQLKNGMVNVPYEEYIDLKEYGIPEGSEIEFSGIDQIKWNSSESRFEGDLSDSGEFSGTLFYWNDCEEKVNKQVDILINPDPKSLWKNIDPPKDAPFYKSNTDFRFEKLENKTLMGVSIRGKSHAQKGTFRDDDFEIHSWNNGWILQVVSDGAGSAEYSRKGSEIACKTTLDKLSMFVEEGKIQEIEDLIIHLNDKREHEDTTSTQSKNKCHDTSEIIILPKESCAIDQLESKLSTLIHDVVVKSAFYVTNKIHEFAREGDYSIKQFSSTLLFVLSKEFDFGTVVITFSIGDGAIGVITENNAELLMEPDGGEYSGQTRFVTMKELFASNEIYQRTNYRLFQDSVEAIVLMTDGVSDPKFATDENLKDRECWLKFWEELKTTLKEDVSEKKMIDWIDFYEKGEYDDRTLTILY